MPSRSPQPVPPNGILPSAKQAQAVERRYGDQAIVASTGHSPHPYSSISLSPDRRYAITACKDILQLLQIRPTGLVVLKSIPMAAHFSTSNTSASRFTEDNKRDSFVDAFLGSDKQSTQMSVVITDVSWSAAFSDKNQTSSYIACAGSNGVIIVWNAMALLEGSTASPNTKSEGATRQVSGSVTAVSPPEAVLSQHIRAVNRLAWHPIRPGLLLSASQDATVLLWERRKVSSTSTLKPQVAAPRLRMLFGGGASNLSQTRYSWHGRARYEPRSEAIRDIKWSPHYEDVFALVTSTGWLIVYNRHVPPRAMVKMSAHSGDSTTLDWHPTLTSVVATGGASDRSVKVWDLEEHLTMKDHKQDEAHNMTGNLITYTSQATESSSETDRSNATPLGFSSAVPPSMRSYSYPNTTNNNTLNSARQHHKGTSPKALVHVLAISASVTRLRWRPPANDTVEIEDDRHVSQMAVATAPIGGASAGGAGALALWSYSRPFMALSVVEGHRDGAVVDFDWLDTPVQDSSKSHSANGTGKAMSSADVKMRSNNSRKGLPEPSSEPFRLAGSAMHETDAVLYDNANVEGDDVDRQIGIWQHVLSVGRDGRCLVQSFVRGDRPISRVPFSCFAMANLSPFQKGYGSLQLFSVCQPVPSGPQDDFYLTGLRRDAVTHAAPGIFREKLLDERYDEPPSQLRGGRVQFPVSPPELVFNVIDQGELDNDSKPVVESNNARQSRVITVAPEVVHLSRFASNYILYPEPNCPTRVDMCHHNASVAQDLNCPNLVYMWRMMAFMLSSAGVDGLPDILATTTSNVMQFVILPTVRNLLLERGEDGDVQSCVALCEVLQVLQHDSVRIPDLEISLVREWYLSYLDLLRDMCLFSHASDLIRHCQDPFVAALNQQSTTIHLSCPMCGKMLPAIEDETRRVCKSCRSRVGMCFLCHEPVRGVFVWCPGCGHGGHLEHALQWFGGSGIREVCPTGCGHRCNMLHQLISFPRTDSLRDLGAVSQSQEIVDMLPSGFWS